MTRTRDYDAAPPPRSTRVRAYLAAPTRPGEWCGIAVAIALFAVLIGSSVLGWSTTVGTRLVLAVVVLAVAAGVAAGVNTITSGRRR